MADPADKPAYAFSSGPPREVSEFLSRKENRPSFSFRDVEPEEHAVAFTVAKSAGFDILDDVREELQRALDEGLTFESFRKRLQPRLKAKGWWDDAADASPTRVPGERGTVRRLRTIYRANMRAARAAGQWARIERTKTGLPYLLYQLGPSERHRPHHEAKAGWVLPVDDPFWDRWFPPNGWGCKCWVRQITRRDAERRGITAEVNIPTRRVADPATGETLELPAGLDPAWRANPGKTRLRNVEALLEGKLATLEPEAQRVAARDLAGSWRARRIHAGEAPGTVPVAVVPPATAEAMGARTAVVRYGGARTPAKMRRKRPDVGTEPLAELGRAFAGTVGETVFPDGLSRVAFVTIGEAWWKMVIQRPARRDDELWLSTWHRVEPRHVEAERRSWIDRGRPGGEASPGS